MYISKVEWLDKQEKEAILKITSGEYTLTCFSSPFYYDLGYILSEPLECLDTDNVILCETKECNIEQLDGGFKYKLKGLLENAQNGVVKIYDFCLHIDKDRIPGDILSGMYVEFITSRIDVW